MSEERSHYIRIAVGTTVTATVCLVLAVLTRMHSHSRQVHDFAHHAKLKWSELDPNRGRLLATKIKNGLPLTVASVPIPSVVRSLADNLESAVFSGTGTQRQAPPLAAWDSLRHVSEIKYLQFHGAVLRGTDSAVLGNLHGLRKLDLTHGDIDNSTLNSIRNLRHLEELYLSGRLITSEGLTALKGHSKLRVLDLRDTGIDDRSIETFLTLKELVYLGLDDDHVTDEAVSRVVSLTKLIQLSLKGTLVSDNAFRDVGRLTELIWIDLSDTQCRNGIIRSLKSCKSLAVVILSNTQIDDRAFNGLDGDCSWETLRLSGTNISDASIPFFSRLTRPRYLIVNGTKISKKGCDELRKLLPGCRVIY